MCSGVEITTHNIQTFEHPRFRENQASIQEVISPNGRKVTSFSHLTDGVCCPLSKNTTLVVGSGVTEEIGAFELWAQNKKLPKKGFLSTFFQENAFVALSQLFTGPFVEETE